MSGDGLPTDSSSPVSPSSFSFSKQPVIRSATGRVPFFSASPSSPFNPESLDRESAQIPSPSTAPPRIVKRYSSSLSQRQGRVPVSGGCAQQLGVLGSPSSGEAPSLPASVHLSAGLFRHKSPHDSALRSIMGDPGKQILCPDNEDIQAFLKTLDALPQPPSLAAHAVQALRSYLPSSSSSLSVPSIPPSPSLLQASIDPLSSAHSRTPMTRAQVDDTLKRMAGSFKLNHSNNKQETARDMDGRSIQAAPPESAGLGGPSIGLLTASRPASIFGRSTTANSVLPGRSARRLASGGSQRSARLSPDRSEMEGNKAPSKPLHSSFKEGSKPAAARSLPGNAAPSIADSPVALYSAGIRMLSPQTTGGASTATNESSSTRTSRRGPVLLRGGFGEQRPSSSPSHSPIRQRTMSERQGEDELEISFRSGPSRTPRITVPNSAGPVKDQAYLRRGSEALVPTVSADPGGLSANDTVQERGRVKEGRVVSDGSKEAVGLRQRTLGGDW